MINILSAAKYTPMILVSKNIKYADIRGGSIGEGASPSSTIGANF